MFLTGFADEASKDFREQIRVTKELNWTFIESRGIGDKTLGTLTDAEFDEIAGLLDASGVRINCYGSPIGNWSRHPRSQADFEKDLEDLRVAIPRMKKLGIKMLRGMSFLITKDETPDSPELEEIIFRKVNEYVRICEENGIVYGHENCMNYGGLSHLHTLKLLDHVKSPNFRLIFDTGNPVFNARHIGTPPYPMQSAWEFYRAVREFIVYVHIKDGVVFSPEERRYTWAGDGCGDVRAIITDLRENGYDGGFSMEPHMGTVYHDASAKSSTEMSRSAIYVEYGRRFEKLLRDCGWKF